MIAIVEARRAGLLTRQHLVNNVVAGIIVGVVALPLAMAFAIASGAKPEQGLYTAIVSGLVVSLLGGSRVQIAGPTGAFIVILASITARYGIDGLQIATLMAGVMLILLGVARFGSIIRYLPRPVISGFTAGIGVIIWVGQWRDFFGLPKVQGEHFHQKILFLLHALPHLHVTTTLLAMASLLLVLVGPRLPRLRKVPGPLIALVVITLLQAILKFDGVATIGSAFGGIPRTLPLPHLPALSLTRLIELTGPAFTIAMLGAIESLLSAVVADGLAGTRHDANQELIGQGLANLLTPVFGGFAATGAIARTATNVRNGGNSPLAGVVHALTLVAIILLLAPLAAYIPLCTLAAILFVVAWNMSELPHCYRIVRRAPQADVVVLLVTFLLTVFVDLVIAVNIGVIVASLLFMRRMAQAVEVIEQSHESIADELTAGGVSALPPDVVIYAIQGPLFFGAVEQLEQVLHSTNTLPRAIVLRFRDVPFLDISGIQALEEAIVHLHRRGCVVLVTEVSRRVLRKLVKAGVIEALGRENYAPSLPEAVSRVTNSKH